MKDWTLAAGVGGTVCVVTGVMSLGTLAVAGAAAAVGYSAGQWILEKVQKKEQEKARQREREVSAESLPYAMQVSLQHWQAYLGANAAGCEVTHDRVAQIFADFEQREPSHAMNIRSIASPQIMQAVQDAAGVTVVTNPTSA